MSTLSPSKILIVDDEPDACTSLARILRLDGYQVEAAHCIEELLQPRTWSDYLAIILDRRLPDGTADELLPDIKSRAPQAAVLIVTGYADLQSGIAAMRNGAEDYLLKPINPDALRATIARFAKLREAELRAAQAERLAGIGQMMAAIAHESRNSLQRIQTGIDLLQMELGDAPQAMQEISKIQRGAADLRALLEEVRDFAAPVNLEKSECDLGKVWRRAWHDVTTVQQQPTAQLEVNSAHGQPVCSVDRFKMEQVFRNLFENSLAACPARPRVQINCVETDISGNSALRISVRDNGAGFANGDAKRAFEPFFSTKSHGTGLGMAIVKRIVEAHGGRIAVGADQQPGAELIITLPKSDD